MNLVFLSNHVSSYRVSTLIALRQRVDRFTILLSSRDCAPGLPEAGITVEFLPSYKIPRTRRHENGYIERFEMHLPHGIGSALRRLKPDCLLGGEFGPRTALGTLYCKMSGTPQVVHADLSEEYELGRGKARLLLRKALLSRIDRVLVNGSSGRRYIRRFGFPDDRIHDLPYATDTDTFGKDPSTSPDDGILRMVYVGQLIERKGLEPFIRNLSDLLVARPDQRVQLTLAGAGDRRGAIESMPRPANLDLRLQGPVEYKALGAFYAGADVFVLPTLSDTWALVVNESMASGLPVLGSRQAQAVVEMVEDGRQGWAFDATSGDDLRRAIEACLDTPREQRRAMGRGAREVALRLTPEYSARQIHDACVAAIDDNARRR